VTPDVYRRRRLTAGAVAGGLVVATVWGISQLGDADSGTTIDAAAADPAPIAAAPVVVTVPEVEPERQPDLAALELVTCTLDVTEVSAGDSGDAVSCVQTALYAATMYDGPISGSFDDATADAVRGFQRAVGLYVDGIVGKNTATELGIWPGVEAFVVRTPPPAPGATDLWGMPLSPVASAGDDAPPLPEGADAVDGKRIVYDRTGQRVWAIDDQERIVRSYLVSGSQYRNEVPGVHTIYSKSESALGWDLTADLPYMIRYTQTERGHIGFHAIPNWRDTGEKLQTVDELGQKLSGGCTRQALEDAQFLWEFADVGDRVVVI
jgi:peptidoglycan hydrolase-like protein with peptidoglycan-binding domain